MFVSDALRALVPLTLPVLQAPMAGAATPSLAAAVCAAGGLGALGLGAANVAAAHEAILATRAKTRRPFNVNFFCHHTAPRDVKTEQAWIARAAPLFTRFDAAPPTELNEIYDSFRDNDDMLRLVLATRPAVVSFHFGLPLPRQTAALRAAGITLIASATSLAEGRAIEAAGFHAVIAQGWQAGGHRGIFDPDAPDERLPTLDLVRQLSGALSLPVIAAGGIMDGHDIRRALAAGAVAAQLGTAFLGCPESAADAAWRSRLARGGTVMTRVISGRPARCLRNDFTGWGADIPSAEIAAYPRAYDLGRALNAAARARGATGFGAQWAGTEAARARFVPVAALMASLAAELRGA